MRLEIVLLPLFFLGCSAYAVAGEPKYFATGTCQDKSVCAYAYEAVVSHSVDVQEQNVTISATVEVRCNSTGEFAYNPNVTEYCLSVTEAFVKHNGIEGTKVTEEDLQRGWFCFVQLETGRIPMVWHPLNENRSVINFKKAIVAGFQANFEGTEEESETDPESVHMSHYRYSQRPWPLHRSGHMYRHFDDHDIDRTATPFPEPVEYSKDEELEYRDDTLFHAHGTSHFLIPRPYHPGPRPRSGQEVQESLMDRDIFRHVRPKRSAWWPMPGRPHPRTQTFNPAVSFQRFSVSSFYKLDQTHCFSDVDVVARKRRDIQDSMRDGYVSSSLTAVVDRETFDNRFQELRQNVPSILEYIHKHPEDTEKVNQLKKLLVVEDKSDSSSAIGEVVTYLQNIRDSPNPEDVAMRQKIYAMLAPLENSDAQQVLLSFVEGVSDSAEWSSLLMNIALLVNPDDEFVTRLQTVIDAGSVRDSSSLLLVYGALASRAEPDLQIKMVAYLNERLRESTGDDGDLIHLIHALGNSGSAQITDILLDYIDYNVIDVQVAVITAMRKQTNNFRVRAVFLEILRAPNSDVRVIGAIANTLIKGVEASGIGDVQTTLALANALVTSSKLLNNEYISECVSYYLSQLRQHNLRVGRRLRRDAENWMFSGPEYDMIASYEMRREDIANYPTHKAYLWSKQIGVRDFNLQVAAGMFTGAGFMGDHKIFGKAIAKVNAFGESATAMEVEMLSTRTDYGEVHKVVYMTVGGYVLIDFETFSEDDKVPTSYGKDVEYPILEFDWEVFTTVATVNTRITLYAQVDSLFEIEADMDSDQNSYVAEGLLSPSLTVRAEGSSTFDVLGTQGGITLGGVIGYQFEAEGYISGCRDWQTEAVVCTTIEDEWPRAYVNLSSWYQTDKSAPCGFELCNMRGDKDPDSVPNQRWSMNANGPELLWEDCDEPEYDLMCSNTPQREWPPVTDPSKFTDYGTERWPQVPVDYPSYDDTGFNSPPVTRPSATRPSATRPSVTRPPVTSPPVTRPPVWATDDTEPLPQSWPYIPTDSERPEFPSDSRPYDTDDSKFEYPPDDYYDYKDQPLPRISPQRPNKYPERQ